jgi:hypothetical protein
MEQNIFTVNRIYPVHKETDKEHKKWKNKLFLRLNIWAEMDQETSKLNFYSKTNQMEPRSKQPQNLYDIHLMLYVQF